MAPLAFPDPPLSADRIRLRPFTEADIPAIVAACQDPEMRRFLTDLPWPYGEREASRFLAVMEKERAEGFGLGFAIAALDDDRLLGTIGVSHLDSRARTATIGYWCAVPARGNGYASAALRLVTSYLFGDLGIERIELTTAPDNLGSQRVARAAGFRLEGYARQEQKFSADGRRRDSLLFALLPEDLTAGSVTYGMSRSLPRIVWINGTFGAGKSSAAAELKSRRPELTVYDPEYVGFILREMLPVPTGDFQDLPEWREVVAATGASLARHRPDGVIAPMTLWQREYLLEVFTGLRAAGVQVLHVLLDAPDPVLSARIDADLEVPAASADFRRARLGDYSGARDFLRSSADLVIETADLSVAEVADRIEPLLG